MSELAAVILSGGTARRLGGVDKSTVEYAGARLLDRSLAAVVDAEPVVVVGPPVPTERPLVFTREDPPLGGPVAGLLAGAAAVREAAGGDPPEWTAVLAVDMPHVTSGTVARLRAAGEIVVQVLPGHEHEQQEFACDRELVEQGAGRWTVRPLAARGQA